MGALGSAEGSGGQIAVSFSRSLEKFDNSASVSVGISPDVSALLPIDRDRNMLRESGTNAAALSKHTTSSQETAKLAMVVAEERPIFTTLY